MNFLFSLQVRLQDIFFEINLYTYNQFHILERFSLDCRKGLVLVLVLVLLRPLVG